jgi:GNAT superfamily N-acetyltransferase
LHPRLREPDHGRLERVRIVLLEDDFDMGPSGAEAWDQPTRAWAGPSANAGVGQYGVVQIRPFNAADAEAAADLVRPLQPAILVTPQWFMHRHKSEPERGRRRSWLAVEGGEAVGFATAGFKWEGPSGVGRFWIGVRPDRRERGVGTSLFELAEGHFREQGGRRLTVEVDDDPAGMRFVEALSFERVGAEVVWSLDPAGADLAELDTLRAEVAGAGFELTTLRPMAARRDDLAAFYEAAGAWSPGGDDANRVTAEELWRVVFERPDLTWDGSFVILDEHERLVSLASLVVDPGTGRGEHEWTATLPELRGRRFALLCKLAAIRWARESGLRELVTANEADNVPMLTLNERLGYRRLYEQVELERDL